MFVCAFLLSTANHRNGKPVSTATLSVYTLNKGECCMLFSTEWMRLWYRASPLSQAFSILLLLEFWAVYLHSLAKSHVISRHGGFVFGLLLNMLMPIPACVAPLLSHIYKTCPYLPLRVLNLNLILLFIAFAFENRPPCSTLTLSLKIQWPEIFCLSCDMKLPDKNHIQKFVPLKWRGR